MASYGCDAPLVEKPEIIAYMPPVRFVLDVTIRPLRGKVVDENGDPIAKVQVSLARGPNVVTPWRGATDEAGKFVWADAPDREVTLQFRARTGYTLSVKLKPQEAEHRIVLTNPNTAQIYGVVRDVATLSPVPDFEVWIGRLPPERLGNNDKNTSTFNINDCIVWLSTATFSGVDGAFELPRPRHGNAHARLVVAITSDGYFIELSEPFPQDLIDPKLQFYMEHAEPISGHIVNATGASAAEAHVYAVATELQAILHLGNVLTERSEDRPTLAAPGLFPLHATTTDEGRFTLPALRAPYQLVAYHQSEGFVTQAYEGPKPPHTLQLQPYGALSFNHNLGDVHRTSLRFRPPQPAWFHVDYPRPLEAGTPAILYERLPAGPYNLTIPVYGTTSDLPNTRLYDCTVATGKRTHVDPFENGIDVTATLSTGTGTVDRVILKTDGLTITSSPTGSEVQFYSVQPGTYALNVSVKLITRGARQARFAGPQQLLFDYPEPIIIEEQSSGEQSLGPLELSRAALLNPSLSKKTTRITSD